MTEAPTLAALEAALIDAQNKHNDAVSASRRASSAECDARNRLNQAQKAIDDRIAELRKNSHRDSDWKRASVRPEVVFSDSGARGHG